MRWRWRTRITDDEEEAESLAKELRSAWNDVIAIERELGTVGCKVKLMYSPDGYHSNSPRNFKVRISAPDMRML